MSNPHDDRDDVKEILAQIASSSPRYRLGKIMGHTGVYVGRKMAAFASDDGVGLKIRKADTEKILKEYPDCRVFMPMGRQMSGWVVLTLDNAEDYITHPLMRDALHLADLAGRITY